MLTRHNNIFIREKTENSLNQLLQKKNKEKNKKKFTLFI